MWDLRFGRPVGDADNPYREQYLMNVMRLLLNTPYIKIIEDPKKEALAAIKFNIEGNNKVDLLLHKDGDISYVTYIFDIANTNTHLKTLAQYLNNKACVIENEKMEMLLDVIR